MNTTGERALNDTAIRDDISAAYTRAMSTPGASCCGPDSGCGTPQPKGATPRLAGYGEEAATLPDDAVVNSFGCGNPLALAGAQPGDAVLDLGSGAAIDVVLAARKVGAAGHVIGVDMTDAMIERARANIAEAGVANAEIRKGIIEELPVESDSIDWVISNCVINLSPDKRRVFAEIARVLRPGGAFSISDIVVEELPDWVRRSTELYSSCVAGAIDEDSYLQGLFEVGLVEVEVTDRLLYAPDQICGLATSAEAGIALGGMPREQIEGAAASLAGKVWSTRFSGRKPRR